MDCFNLKCEGLIKYSLTIALYVFYLDFLSFYKLYVPISIRNVDKFNFKQEMLNKNRYVDYFNFKHEGLIKNILIIALCLSYLQFLLFLEKWMHINYNKKCGPFQFQA